LVRTRKANRGETETHNVEKTENQKTENNLGTLSSAAVARRWKTAGTVVLVKLGMSSASVARGQKTCGIVVPIES
jgi:hypothetical protein